MLITCTSLFLQEMQYLQILIPNYALEIFRRFSERRSTIVAFVTQKIITTYNTEKHKESKPNQKHLFRVLIHLILKSAKEILHTLHTLICDILFRFEITFKNTVYEKIIYLYTNACIVFSG